MAIELDPLYARAYAGTADCDSFLFLDYSEEVSLDGILASAAKALEIDSGLAEAHASRGLALAVGQRYEEAETAFEQVDRRQSQSVRSALFLRPLLLRTGEAGEGRHSLGARGRDRPK